MSDNAIRFLQNNKVIIINDYDPYMSILKYLRLQAGRYGAKDGCSTGDCGACTVVVGELIENRLTYKTINSCISLLPCLHGKQLITVEDLADGDHLHPVQQCVVDFHGSQCGFCSTGVVMSLFALVKQYPQPTKEHILHALTGNLCRCTGYRSILNAASFLCSTGQEDKFDRDRESVFTKLITIQSQECLKLSSHQDHYYAPTRLDDLAGLLLDHPEAQLLAGGTSLISKAELNLATSDKLIYIGNIAELKTITETDKTIVIGAAAPISECSNRLQAEFEDFGVMLMRFGSQQIRNQGTFGGNIANASPIGDMLPALIVLGARVTLRQGDFRRSMLVEHFLVGYKATALKTSEFIQSIEIPKAKPGFELKLYKISKRQDIDRSTIFGAFYLHVHNDKVVSVRIAFGGMADMPKRADHCEAALLKQPWNKNAILQAMAALEQDFHPISDIRASAAYRLRVAKNLLLKCFVEWQSGAENYRVTNYE